MELETPGFDNIVYTPTGSDTGTLVVDENTNGIYDAAAVDSIITIGPFVFFCPDPPPGFTYISSPGGAEEVVYDGEGGNDDFTIVGTALADTIRHTPGADPDEGHAARQHAAGHPLPEPGRRGLHHRRWRGRDRHAGGRRHRRQRHRDRRPHLRHGRLHHREQPPAAADLEQRGAARPTPSSSTRSKPWKATTPSRSTIRWRRASRRWPSMRAARAAAIR